MGFTIVDSSHLRKDVSCLKLKFFVYFHTIVYIHARNKFNRFLIPFRILVQEISGKVSVDQMKQEEVWT